jgi:hypothetical protein
MWLAWAALRDSPIVSDNSSAISSASRNRGPDFAGDSIFLTGPFVIAAAKAGALRLLASTASLTSEICSFVFNFTVGLFKRDVRHELAFMVVKLYSTARFSAHRRSSPATPPTPQLTAGLKVFQLRAYGCPLLTVKLVQDRGTLCVRHHCGLLH